MDDLKLKSVTKSQCEIYKFWFDPFGWAFFIIDEESGMLAIHSDWGDWVHSWNPEHFNEPTLKEFIIKTGVDYLTMKLTNGDKGVWDPEATRKKLEEDIRETFEDDKERMEERLLMLKNSEWGMGPDIFIYDSELWDEYFDLPELLVFRPKPEVENLRNDLFPFFKEYLRDSNGDKAE